MALIYESPEPWIVTPQKECAIADPGMAFIHEHLATEMVELRNVPGRYTGMRHEA